MVVGVGVVLARGWSIRVLGDLGFFFFFLPAVDWWWWWWWWLWVWVWVLCLLVGG